jgi:hypothetical protein
VAVITMAFLMTISRGLDDEDCAEMNAGTAQAQTSVHILLDCLCITDSGIDLKMQESWILGVPANQVNVKTSFSAGACVQASCHVRILA